MVRQQEKITSPLTKLVRFGRFQQDFEIRDLDVAKSKTNDDSLTLEYENLTYDESLAIRMNMYGNKGKGLGYFTLDTQADRRGLTFITLPKLQQGSREAYNLARTDGANGFMHDQILLDLYRMADAQDVIETQDEARMIEGYHYVLEDGVRNYNKEAGDNLMFLMLTLR